MSQYLPGIVDYIPSIQPFKPDFNFYQQVLQLKNAQYEEGYNKLSSVYGTLLNSPLLRQSNIETRNKFFSDISSQITKISSMDLSRAENVDAAYKVFQPLINDKYLAKDMVFTKDAQRELSRADEFRNCIDEKKCGGKYWEGGIRSIYYKMDDFAKSSNDESLRFNSPRYVPAVNVVEKAMKFAKENGFSQENLTYSPDGRFMIVTANGEVAVPYLTDLFHTMFASDQTTVDYYNELGFLKRKDYIAQTKDQFGTPEEAELNYINTISSELIDVVDKKNKVAQKTVDNVNTKAGAIKAIEKTRQLDETDPYDQVTLAQKQQLEIDKMVAEMNADIQRVNKETLNPEVLNSDDLASKRARIDAVVASTLLQNDLSRAAYDYAMLTQKIEKVEADPYKLASFENSLDLNRDFMLHQYRMAEIAEQNKGKKGKGSSEGGEEEEEDDLMTKILKAAGNAFTPLTTGSGSTAKVDLYKEEFLKQNGNSKVAANAVKGVVDQVIAEYGSIINTPIGTKTRINGQEILVTQDIINQAKTTLEQLFTANKAVTETRLRAQSNAPAAKDYISNLTGVPGFITGLFLPDTGSGKEVKEEVVRVTKNGLYTDDYRTAVADNEDFYNNPNSDIYYEKVYKNLQTILGDPSKGFNDPLANIILAKNETLAALGKANDDLKNYKLTQTALANKEKAVNNLVAETFDVSDKYNPVYAKAAISGYVKPGGGQKTKEEFINDYVRLSLPATTSVMPGFVRSVTPEDFKEEAEELYNEYTQSYKNAWNQDPGVSSDILKSKAVQNSILGGFNAAKGAGAEQAPYTSQGYSNVPTQTSYDYITTMVDINNALSNPNLKDRIKVFENVSGNQITADDFEDGVSLTNSSDQFRIMNAIKDAILQKKKGEKTVGWQQIVHPIVGNNYETVGFEIVLGEDFINANRKEGQEGATGITASTNRFTVTLPKEALSPENQIISRLERGPYSNAMILSPDNKVKVDQYAAYGGTFEMKGVEFDPAGLVTRAQYTLDILTYDPTTNNFTSTRTTKFTNNPDEAGMDAEKLMGEQYTQNFYLKRSQNQ